MALDYSITLKPLSPDTELKALKKVLSKRFQLQFPWRSKLIFDELVSVGVFKSTIPPWVKSPLNRPPRICLNIRLNKFDWDNSVLKMLKISSYIFQFIAEKAILKFNGEYLLAKKFNQVIAIVESSEFWRPEFKLMFLEPQIR
jgi:hypothetical protein